jgi:hypothetical protein
MMFTFVDIPSRWISCSSSTSHGSMDSSLAYECTVDDHAVQKAPKANFTNCKRLRPRYRPLQGPVTRPQPNTGPKASIFRFHVTASQYTHDTVRLISSANATRSAKHQPPPIRLKYASQPAFWYSRAADIGSLLA